MSRPVVLAFSDYYLPGYRAGGPVRTLEGIVALLAEEFEFRIVTRDRDLGSPEPYPGVRTDTWEPIAGAYVRYLSVHRLTPATIRRAIQSTPHHILYLNSLFSVPFSICPLWLRRLRLVQSRPTIVAPRGEMAEGALALKHRRKALYLRLSRRLSLYDGVLWQASSQHELEEIRRILGAKSQVLVAPDLAVVRSSAQVPVSESAIKKAGILRAVFLSRISRNKNLDGALAILSGVAGRVELTIYGPIEDERYWKECQSASRRLPPNVSVRYEGEVAPELVLDTLSSHDLLFLPTLGENYGHVIVEALSVGRPVLISDRTPWRNLEGLGVGWDVSVGNPHEFRRIIDQCVAMDSEGWRQLSEAAASYGARIRRDPEVQERNRALFRSRLQRSGIRGMFELAKESRDLNK